MIDISTLNRNQKESVLCDDKYLRIVAGAGSGKTRVLTMRIAHLIEDEGVPGYRILAITFTNKAANEMKERIRRMIPDETSQPWISTIHSLCVRILREDIQTMGWPRNFTVMDADDQKTVLKEAYKKLNIDAQRYPYGSLLDYISNNKTAEISVEYAYTLAGSFSGEKTKAQVYEYYMKRQNELLALDFDDLILWVVRMFRKYPEVLAKWQNRYRYIHVDEFQDIDQIQYTLIKQLAGTENSLYVVGDPDQTIYTWRGADVNIIMNFTKDFPSARTITLNENYRSTEHILNGANAVIRNNKNRLEKDLFTSRKGKEKITHYSSAGEQYEAEWIASKIRSLHQSGADYRSIAVLYRSNYLSRSLEKALLDARIPYIIYGGIRFYERQEVKDALCYLRMTATADDLAFQRIINRPKRGIGNKSLDAIAEAASEEGCTMFEVCAKREILGGKTGKKLKEFTDLVQKWQKEAEEKKYPVFELFEHIMEESGYRAMLDEQNETDRLENIKELIEDVKEFSENNPDSSLEEYLQLVSLYGDRDETLGSDFVQLMTVHSAKGLEFDTVFVSDLNEGIFPNERAMNEGRRGLEEERRLAYVAFTRARNKLYLTEAGGYSYMLQRVRTRSRFIDEIDPECIEHLGAAANDFESGQERKLSSILFADRNASFFDRLEQKGVPEFKKGEQVVHDKFGEGIVIRSENGYVDVAFGYPHGVKKLLAGHPTLKRKADLKN
ncbi:MAG: UvrD-helicase domain-containing protein [Erysipelotrichaceae bacterium]|nr:UvrD-helicase domain-containing protein [Erysipelotrichaceae bacterium]